MSQAVVLEAIDIVKELGEGAGKVLALKGVSLTLRTGELTLLMGPSGSGKTTLLSILGCILTPTSGTVRICGETLNNLDVEQLANLRRRHIGYIFQSYNLFPHKTALENVMVGCQVRRKSQWWMPVFSLPSARREEEEIREKAKGLIHRLALDSYMDEKASSLPYGAQRRLEIARALATSPDFLLLDEPAAGMNPQESTELMRFIRHIRDEFDLTILLIEHDMKVVMGVCQYIWVLEYGQLIAEGDPDAIRNNPRVIEAYLGEDVSNHA